MKPVIGIVPTAKLYENNDPYADRYLFVNNYIKRIGETGGLPIGMLSADGVIDEGALELCDAFLLCGGTKVWPYHLQIIDHALQKNKPVLGICLGMQAICIYFCVREEMEKRDDQGGILQLFEKMKRERYMFTKPIAHHWDVPMTRESIEETKHPVYIMKGTRLHRLLGQDEIHAASMHNYAVNGVPPALDIAAQAQDGTVEGIEYEDLMIGVQFHPEIEDELDVLFRTLYIV